MNGVRTHFGYGSVHVSEPILGMGQNWVQDLGVGTRPIFTWFQPIMVLKLIRIKSDTAMSGSSHVTQKSKSKTRLSSIIIGSEDESVQLSRVALTRGGPSQVMSLSF